MTVCLAAPLGGTTSALASERLPDRVSNASPAMSATDFSAARRRYHSNRGNAAAIAAFAGIAGTIGAIAAAQSYDRGPAYGYGGGYGYGPGYGYGGPVYHGYYGGPQYYGPGLPNGRYRGTGPGYGWQDRGGF